MSHHVYITATGSYLPGDAVSNDDMEARLGFINDKYSRLRGRILANNGIISRHYAIDPTTSRPSMSNASLTARAVEAVLKTRNMKLDEVACLACGTSTPDQIAPHHGAMVQGELKLPPCEVIGTSGICCSGVSALKYGYMNVLSGLTPHAITTGSERVSALLNARHFKPEIDIKLEELEANPSIAFSQDFLRWMLSDGAGAFMLESKPRPGHLSLHIDWLEIISFAGDYDACMYWGGKKKKDGQLEGWLDVENPEDRIKEGYMNLTQDVKLLNPHIVRVTVQETLEHIQKKRTIDASSIDWFLPHYSSHYFRDQVDESLKAAGLDIPQEKWFTNLSTKGNTGAASIYLMIDELMNSGRLKAGQKVLCYVPESSRFSSSFFQLTAVQGS